MTPLTHTIVALVTPSLLVTIVCAFIVLDKHYLHWILQ